MAATEPTATATVSSATAAASMGKG